MGNNIKAKLCAKSTTEHNDRKKKKTRGLITVQEEKRISVNKTVLRFLHKSMKILNKKVLVTQTVDMAINQKKKKKTIV